MTKETKTIGYLPDENPSFGKLLLFALQQILVMFPATVLVALITGFHVSTTIFASGLATVCFILITKKQIPLYYGSSFSYITAITSITLSESWVEELVAPNHLIQQAQFGIVLSGLVSIGVGLLVRRFSMEKIEKVLPPQVTGPIAIIIGLSLAGTALTDAINLSQIPGITEENQALAQNLGWVIALVTLLATIMFSVYVKRKTWGQIPILLGLLVGYVLSLIIGWFTDIKFVHFALLKDDFNLWQLPHFTLPKVSWQAALAIMPIAIATIPESTAHLFQLDIYVKKLAVEKQTKKEYKLSDKLGINLIGDGIGDMVSGMIGGPAGTNYGENISTMAITKNYSVMVLLAAGVITMIISLFTPLSAVVYSLPKAVISGISIYLFGIIASQGVTIMFEKKVNLFEPRNLAIISVIFIVGLGGSYGFANGLIPIFGISAPSIATAAILGILINLLFLFGDFLFKPGKTAE